LVIVLGPNVVAGANEPDSGRHAVELAKLLEQRKLDAFAAEDPAAPGRFAAVLYFPGVQTLMVAGNYPAPELLRQRIDAGQYREVYTDLSTAAARDGRLFVEDFGVPGLRATRDGNMPFDITWRNTTSSIKYDGNWGAQKLSEQQYQERFERDNAEYTHVLQALTNALAGSGG
jgi:hypothetical protein